jgi:hypothetical protein
MNKSENKIKMTDITHIIQEAASCLSFQKPFLAREAFNLYDSMSALDLMEPKMDGCEIDASYYLRHIDNHNTISMMTSASGSRTDGSASSSSDDVTSPSATTANNSGATSNATTNGVVQGQISKVTPTTIPPRPVPCCLSSSIVLPWSEYHHDDPGIKGVPLTIARTRVILVQMLVRLESFLAGNSATETIYTCIYAHSSILLDMHGQLYTTSNCENNQKKDKVTEEASDPLMNLRLLQETVYISTRLMVKLAETIVKIVQRADIYQEEDFTIYPQDGNFSKDSFDFACNSQHEMLDQSLPNSQQSHQEALSWSLSLDQLLYKAQNIKEKWRCWLSSLSLSIDQKDPNWKDGQIICHCINCMVYFLEACTVLTSLNKDNVVQNVEMLQSSILENAVQLQEFVKLLKKEQQQEENDGEQDDGNEQKNGAVEKTQQQRRELIQETVYSAFDPFINRPALGNTPVRQITFSTPENALENLLCIYKELESSVCKLLLKGNTLARIQRILSNLSMSISSSWRPCIKLNILCRSLIVINLYFDNLLLGQYDFAIAIAEDMYCNAVPNTVFTTTYGKHFLERLCKPFYDVLKLYALNRNRQRAFMDLVIFREWNVLQDEAATVDVSFQNELEVVGQEGDKSSCMGSGSSATRRPIHLYVSNYILSTKIGLMEHHIGLGIELGIFHGHYHLLTAFWYREFLLSTRLSILSSMKEKLIARMAMEEKIRLEELADQEKSKGNKGKKKGKRNNKKNAIDSVKNASQSLQSTEPWKLTYSEGKHEQDTEHMFLNAKKMLCRGIVRVSAIECVKVAFLSLSCCANL